MKPAAHDLTGATLADRSAANPVAGSSADSATTSASMSATPSVANRLQHLLRRQPPGSPPHPLAAVLAAYHQRRVAEGLSAAPAAEPSP